MIYEEYITENEVEVDNGIVVKTYQYNHPSEVNVDIEIGTTNSKGGDAGNGARTYFRMENQGNTCFSHVRPILPHGRFDNYEEKPIEFKKQHWQGVEFVVGGDWEIRQMIEAFEFGLYVLKKQTDLTGYDYMEGADEYFEEYIEE